MPSLGKNPLVQCQYLLDVEDAGGVYLRSFVLPHVNAYSATPTPATDFEWTLGEDPIRDHSGVREHAIALSGRSGIGLFSGRNQGGNAIHREAGPEFIPILRGFLKDYCDDAKQKPGMRLVLRALGEGDHYYVEPLPPEFRRDVGSSRFSWLYSMRFRAYGEAKVVAPPGVPDPTDATKAAAALSFLDSVLDFLAQGILWAATVRGFADAFILGPIRSVEAIAQEVTVLAAAVGSVVAIPTDVAVAVLDVVAGAVVALGALFLALPLGERGKAAVRGFFFDAAATMGEMRRGTIALLSQYRLPVPETTPSARASNDDTPRRSLGTTTSGGHDATPALPYAVSSGQSIAVIAEVVLGDVTLVPTILVLNGMLDPYTMSDGSPFGPGVTIMLPQTDGIAVQTSGTGAAKTVDVYGTDLLLDASGDLVCPGTDPTDFALVSGHQLLKQALSCRLRTVQRQHGVWPAYGLIPTVGEPTAFETAGRIAASVRAQILRDARFTDVQELTVEDLGDGYNARCLAVPRAGPPINLIVPVAA